MHSSDLSYNNNNRLAFVWDYPVEPVPEETFMPSSGFYGAGEDNRGRHTDSLAGSHPIRTINAPTSIIPTIFMLCPSFRNPPNFSWLGTGTKYAGLHTRS